ncbi:hypothetical protein BC940DRAFT_314352 [Gongronella butleri]|nr:hypothetical protein BC940DRAFT_314352 [Gongronella butleri]
MPGPCWYSSWDKRSSSMTTADIKSVVAAESRNAQAPPSYRQFFKLVGQTTESNEQLQQMQQERAALLTFVRQSEANVEQLQALYIKEHQRRLDAEERQQKAPSAAETEATANGSAPPAAPPSQAAPATSSGDSTELLEKLRADLKRQVEHHNQLKMQMTRLEHFANQVQAENALLKSQRDIDIAKGVQVRAEQQNVMLRQRMDQIKNLEAKNKESELIIRDMENALREKDATIRRLNVSLAENDARVRAMDDQIKKQNESHLAQMTTANNRRLTLEKRLLQFEREIEELKNQPGGGASEPNPQLNAENNHLRYILSRVIEAPGGQAVMEATMANPGFREAVAAVNLF